MNVTSADQQASIDEPWFYKVHAVVERIRSACKGFYYPSSHIVIDEAMILFKGRSNHTIKMKNKLINEGYKL